MRASLVSSACSTTESVTSRSWITSGEDAVRSSFTAAAIARISVGVVPQHPPMIFAPRSRACAAKSAK